MNVPRPTQPSRRPRPVDMCIVHVYFVALLSVRVCFCKKSCGFPKYQIVWLRSLFPWKTMGYILGGRDPWLCSYRVRLKQRLHISINLPSIGNMLRQGIL